MLLRPEDDDSRVRFTVVMGGHMKLLLINLLIQAFAFPVAAQIGASTLDIDAAPVDPVVSQDQIFVVTATGTLRRIDASDPTLPNPGPELLFSESITRVFGPFMDLVYAAGADSLYVVDVATTQTMAVLPYAGVRRMAFRDDLAVLLTDGGDDLVVASVENPLELLQIGGLPLPGSDIWMGAEFHGDLVLLSSMLFQPHIIDVSEPSSPTVAGSFGYCVIPPMGRTTETYHVSMVALGMGDAFTADYYEFIDSGAYPPQNVKRGEITRWDLSDPANPVATANDTIVAELGNSLWNLYTLRDQELLLVAGSHIYAIDLSGSDLDGGRQLAEIPGEHGGPRGFHGNEQILALVTSDGSLHVLAEKTAHHPVPAPVVRLDVPVPNPFNPQVTLSFDLARAGHVSLTILDLGGREVCTLVDKIRGAGPGQATWNGRDRNGRVVPSGTYLARVSSSGETHTRKLTLVH
jgi:hypothetical protein